MRRSRDELRTMEQEEAQRTGKSAEQMEEAKRRAMARMEDRHNKIMAAIKKLQDERHDIAYTPPMKEALAKTMKDALKATRKSVIELYFKKHVEACQKNSNAKPFDNTSMRFMFGEGNAWRLVPFCISNKDIDCAISGLDEIGIPEEERENKLEEIDKEIDRLFKTLKQIHNKA